MPLPMKALRLIVLLTVAATGAVLAPAQEAVSYLWKFAAATEEGGRVQIMDASGRNALTFPSGARVEVDPKAPGGRVVLLSGEQEEGVTARTIEPLPAVQIEINFKPTGATPETQTLVALNAAYELRYNAKRKQLEFIVFHADKKYTIVRNNIAPNAWNYATATFLDGKATLAIGKAAKDLLLPAGTVVDPKPARMRVGRQSARPFVGAIAELSIKEL